MATQVTRVETQLPAALVAEMEALVAAGWFRIATRCWPTLCAATSSRTVPNFSNASRARMSSGAYVAGSESAVEVALDAGPIIHLDEIDALDRAHLWAGTERANRER